MATGEGIVAAVSAQLFAGNSILTLRDVVLAQSDAPQIFREKLARVILDEMYQFVGLLDADGMTLEINRAALEGAGIRLSDIRGKPFWEARWWQVSNATREKQRELCGRAARGEFIRCDIEIYGRSAGEETIVIDFSIMPVRDQLGRIVFLLAEGRNITEKKAAQAELARKNEELQRLLDQIRQLDQLKSDLFANVSHELRTPLALILGPAESMLAAGVNLTEMQRRDLGVIRHNAATLLKPVNDLLDLAKLDAGQMRMDYVDIDLSRLVRIVAAHFDALAPQRMISYVIVAPDVVRAQIDAEKLERVLLNLLANAFKFTPPGGRIRCALAVRGEGFILAVQDSGPGIPPAMRNQIFERFRQAQGGTTREFSGTGLGLSIARDFVELHGGTIAVCDAPAGGTLVQVEIPLRAPRGSVVRIASESEAAPAVSMIASTAVEELKRDQGQNQESVQAAGRPTVLVVEDRPEMRRFIAETLSSDYRVITAADGVEGLARAIAEETDLVVTDLMMPKLGGDEFAKHLRAHHSLPQPPVLVLSAKADDTLRLRLLAESVQNYLIKPFSAAELGVRVRNLIEIKRAKGLLQEELASQGEDLALLTRELIESKRLIEENLEAHRQFTALVKNSHDFIGFTSREGNALFVNPAGMEQVGLSEEEVQRTSPLCHVVLEDQDLLRRGIATAVETGNWEGEVRFRRFGTGAVIPMHQTIFVVDPMETGGKIGLATISRDIRERKRIEEGLRQAQAELAHVSRLADMGELSAPIAHEVNQPLSAVVANANACARMLDAQPLDPEELRLAISDIAGSGRRASEIITRIRNQVKKSNSCKLKLDINEVIVDVMPLIRGELDRHRTKLDTQLEQSLPPIFGDRVELQQVLINLLMNGIEAMLTTMSGPRALTVRLQLATSGEVVVAVCDSGSGLPTDQMGKLFDSFFTTKPNGMGLGLPISRSIIEAHGGKLWATPNPTDGATFQFALASAA
jgi:PAS domain S-box-containing protein